MISGSLRAGMRACGLGVAVALLGLPGCGERDRLTFNAPGGGNGGPGPMTVITRPLVDTTVAAGPGFFVVGQTTDPDDVDSIYFETEGGVSTFPPMVNNGTVVNWAIPLTTSGQSGQTITVRVFGTDGLGNRGDSAVRRVAIQ